MRPKLLTMLLLLQLGTTNATVVNEGDLKSITDDVTEITRYDFSPKSTTTSLYEQLNYNAYWIQFIQQNMDDVPFNTMITMLNDTPGTVHLDKPTGGVGNNILLVNHYVKNDVTMTGETTLRTKGEFGGIHVEMNENYIKIETGHVDKITGTTAGDVNNLEITENGGLGEPFVAREVRVLEAQIAGRTDNVLLNVEKLMLDGMMTLDTNTHTGTRGSVVFSERENARAEIVVGPEGKIELVGHEDNRGTEYAGIWVRNIHNASITNNGFISATSSTTASERNSVAGIALEGGTVTNNGEINSTQFALISNSGETGFVNNGTITGAVGRNESQGGELTFANNGTWNVRSNPQDAGRETTIDAVQNFGLITTTTANGDQKLISRQLINAGEIDVRENTLTLLGDYSGVHG
ncbi:TPA: hypothetical protein RU587_005102, partial [Salmonella enterica]|nr:hypothetical protein [Salmonella enterica]